MARRSALQVEGARTLRATLKRAGVQLSDLRAAHADVAQLVHARAQPKAPRRSGRLAGTERPAGTQSAAIVRAGFAATPYAGPIHWGWDKRHIKAQPWIYDAAVSTKGQWEAKYMAALEHIINTVEGAPGP
jgi:hypothetical protein